MRPVCAERRAERSGTLVGTAPGRDVAGRRAPAGAAVTAAAAAAAAAAAVAVAVPVGDVRGSAASGAVAGLMYTGKGDPPTGDPFTVILICTGCETQRCE